MMVMFNGGKDVPYKSINDPGFPVATVAGVPLCRKKNKDTDSRTFLGGWQTQIVLYIIEGQ